MMQVATHNGVFHADEVVACAIMSTIHDIKIIRTRDPEVINTADMVIDVGGVYDMNSMRYDHHQKDAPVRHDGTPYSSAGLVWLNHGVSAIMSVTGSTQNIQSIWANIDREVITPIDMIDNGVSTGTRFRSVELSNLVSMFNPTWMKEAPDIDAAFLEAVDFAKKILARKICSEYATFKAEDVVNASYNDSADKRLLVLERFVPWKSYVKDLHDVMFVVFPDPSGKWMLSAVPANEQFEQRKYLPNEWGGASKDALIEMTGVSDIEFVHKGRFIGGAKTREGAMKMAALALAE